MATPFSYSPEKAQAVCADYARGLSTRQCAVVHGLSQAITSRIVSRAGIARESCKAHVVIDNGKIVALRNAGHGIKEIGKIIGCSKQTIKERLIVLGAYDTRADHASGIAIWAGRSDELDAENRVWKQHDEWWYEAHTIRYATQMDRYYSNHEASKLRAAHYGRMQYAKIKHRPEYKVKMATRRAVQRMARTTGVRRKPRTRTFEYLGCNYDQARAHIEKQFRDGMEWANHGTVWEIDHIRPLASFNLLDDEQRKQACHYTNLQPLTVLENRTKGDKYIPPSKLTLFQ